MASGPTTRSAQDLVDRGGTGVIDKTGQEILLQRHPSGRGSGSQGGMDLGGNIFDLDTRHRLTLAA